ncbi:MAG: biopolymer transporter ExbD [Acidobacteria bacterium]|nr:biopolymer transporter ExbD [Acidobacteriota bacterium]
MASPRCEPNITPLIDIVLVLLIVFMVMVPGLQVAAIVNLPAKGTGGAGRPPLKVKMDGAGLISVDGQPVIYPELPRAVAAGLRDRFGQDRRAVVAVHAGQPFQRAADLLDVVKGLHPDVTVALVEAKE